MSIRKILLTIYFWLWATVGAVAALLYVVYKALLFNDIDHDIVTFGIEQFMAPIIFYAMTIPKFWTVDFFYAKSTMEDEEYPQILASNHNSMVDTLFIALLYYRKTYSYNYKYRFVPIFGQLCMLAGYVGIQTNNAEQKSKVVDRIIEKMKEDYSIMIYPEGSRNKNPGSLLSRENIKTGAFRIALAGKYPIRPIYIHNSHKIMGKWGIIDVGNVVVNVLPTFKVEDVRSGVEKFVEVINAEIARYD